ncbi:Hypothetical protein NAEGRDRAFT_69112 [Naegleria gruberi]|uniref:F-box domain-containing protein n=1 Tax=Naegleria gruberi TaxID=5762 RepID=D2VJP3_NAEGR|nr:uncharacterized protein NAEGRDRAFT_69112 [Naegleria gruberi]EFC43066.1 Hypothetical protein NAEGRDRAFT_69112 [Naegleria gruberi]|eukprot:XP_002675810.1 Hypothetical protein NAEGRDRAFT_69112 [Naegleria gruberi strain NEG-M]
MKRKESSKSKQAKRPKLDQEQMKLVALLDEALSKGKLVKEQPNSDSSSTTLSSSLVKEPHIGMIQLNGVECPDELLSLIFDFLDVESLQRSQLVSKKCYLLSVEDRRYEKAMREEFPIYTKRLEYLNEFYGLKIKLLRRRFITRHEERLFWWIVEASNTDEDKVFEIIVENCLLDQIDKIASQFRNAQHKLYVSGKDAFGIYFEDDSGLYAMCEIISKGEEFFRKVCAQPILGRYAFKTGHEMYMYSFSDFSYIPMKGHNEDETTYQQRKQDAIQAFVEGYEAFKKHNL